MENLKIAKKFSTKTVKEQELFMDTVTLEDGSQKSVQKVREVEKEQKFLDNKLEDAFHEASLKADKLGYVSVSLIAEDEENYTFQLYNKVEKKKEEGDQ